MGAYQEALSDDHNLMGKFNIVSINDPDDPTSWSLVPGSALNDVLEHVHHNSSEIQRQIRDLIQSSIDAGRIDKSSAEETRCGTS